MLGSHKFSIFLFETLSLESPSFSSISHCNWSVSFPFSQFFLHPSRFRFLRPLTRKSKTKTWTPHFTFFYISILFSYFSIFPHPLTTRPPRPTVMVTRGPIILPQRTTHKYNLLTSLKLLKSQFSLHKHKSKKSQIILSNSNYY